MDFVIPHFELIRVSPSPGMSQHVLHKICFRFGFNLKQLLVTFYSGFFDKTPVSSSRKRTIDTRDRTPGTGRTTDARDETPGNSSRRSRRFGWLDVTSVSGTPYRGYRSNEGEAAKKIICLLKTITRRQLKKT